MAAQTIQAVADADIAIDWFSGTGKGGQHRNKHQNSCRLTHIPTGITVTAQCRKRTQSYNQAYAELCNRVSALDTSQQISKLNADRAAQVGSGMRADKVRTYRFQDDSVTDHTTGKSAKAKRVMRGGFDLLWPKS